LQDLQRYVRDVDVDRSGRLELKEVLKVARKLRSVEYEAIEYLFTIYDKDESGTLSTEDGELQRFLRKLGYMATPETVQAALKAAGQSSEDGENSDPQTQADFWGVVRIVAEYRLVQRKVFRECAGFSEEQVTKFRHKFNKYDRDQSGDVACSELIRLLEDMFPNASKTDAEHERLKQMLSRIDTDGNPSIDFKEFLQLCRQYQDERDENMLTREAAAVEKTGFKPEEVAEFRNVFRSADMDANQYLSGVEIRHLLSRIVGSFSETAGKELVGIFREFSGDGARQLDFPDFLLFMKRLIDMNFADINTKAAEIVTRSGGFTIPSDS
jgi:Ca2+-binding EF-hand superfamily protein